MVTHQLKPALRGDADRCGLRVAARAVQEARVLPDMLAPLDEAKVSIVGLEESPNPQRMSEVCSSVAMVSVTSLLELIALWGPVCA